MRTNELDRHFLIDFIMGGVVFVVGLVGFILSLTWDISPMHTQFQNSSSFGFAQCAGVFISFLMIAGSGLYIKNVIEYMQAYGE